MTARTHDERPDDLLLFASITIGAVIGFSLTGGAAVGTVIGAATGTALVALHHRLTSRPHGHAR